MMKSLILFLLISFSAFADEKVCLYNCPSFSAGYVGTFGNVNTLLDKGLHLSFAYTPKWQTENLNKKISGTNIKYFSELYLAYSVEWYHFTGPLLNRTTDYYAPAIHLNWTRNLFNGQINSSLAYGYGITQIDRTGYSGSQWTSIILVNSVYEKNYSFGTLGAGVEVGSILNENYPLNHYGLLLKFGRQF